MKHERNFSLKKALVCLLLLALVPISALADFAATVKSSTMRVYSTNNTGWVYYLGSLKKGTQVTVTAVKGNWCKITYKGRKGFAQVKDLKKVSTYTKWNGFTKRQAKVYTTASTGSKVVDVLTADYPLTIIGVKGSFYEITNTNGKGHGYVLKDCISKTKVNRFKIADSAKGTYNSKGSSTTVPAAVKSTQSYLARSMSKTKYANYIIYAAQSRLGCAYSKSPNNTTTFSNPSFVRSCFASLGYSVPANVQTIGHKGSYAYISRKSLKRGDIVCFENDSEDSKVVDHVGIYLGKNYFIHVSPSAKMVVVSSMASGYYNKAFCWGRRIIK